jgi:hypothetical protein
VRPFRCGRAVVEISAIAPRALSHEVEGGSDEVEQLFVLVLEFGSHVWMRRTCSQSSYEECKQSRNANAVDEKKRRLDIKQLSDCEHLRGRIEGTKALQRC